VQFGENYQGLVANRNNVVPSTLKVILRMPSGKKVEDSFHMTFGDPFKMFNLPVSAIFN